MVVAEGAKAAGGEIKLKAAASAGHVERLGGIGEVVAHDLQELTGKESRAVVLGHLLVLAMSSTPMAALHVQLRHRTSQ